MRLINGFEIENKRITFITDSESGEIVEIEGFYDPPRCPPDNHQKFEILERQNWRCNICSKLLRFPNKTNEKMHPDRKKAHFDHIWPYSKRFSYPLGFWNINRINNYQATCRECNMKKFDKVVQ